MQNTKIKVSQYSDDKAMFSDGTEESLRGSLSLIETFRNISGQRQNNSY